MVNHIKTYGNKYKNQSLSGVKDLYDFLKLIAYQDKKLNFYAIGGTAMVLGNIKENTKDIDFLTDNTYEEVKSIFTIAGLKEEQASTGCNKWYKDDLRIDVFYHDMIMGIALPDDWEKESIFVKQINKIKLYILSWYYVIITKIARFEKRDIEDVMEIMIKEKINFGLLKQKYYEICEISVLSDYDEKFKRFEKIRTKNEK